MYTNKKESEDKTMSNTAGGWKIGIVVDAMPQKVATAIGKMNETLIGAEYTPIAYIGSQIVNGVNHAVLMEQLLTTGKDTKNVVLVIFNEKPNSMEDLSIVSIDRVVEGGWGLGGTVVDVKTEIPEDAQAAFDAALTNFVGSSVKPFALLATQVTKGTNYVFAAEVKPVVPEAEAKFEIVVVNGLNKSLVFIHMLESRMQVSLGKPLGEWP